MTEDGNSVLSWLDGMMAASKEREAQNASGFVVVDLESQVSYGLFKTRSLAGAWLLSAQAAWERISPGEAPLSYVVFPVYDKDVW